MVKGGTIGDDIGKLFVGGLSHETTQESLKNYFSDFGLVTDVVVMKDQATKKPRGFGFVTFQDPSSVMKVVNHPGPHVVDNKTIDPKQAVPRGPGQAGTIQTQHTRDNNAMKVFVGGIASGTTEEDLRNYFSAYGMVEVKKAEKRDSKPGGMSGGGMPGMGAYPQPSGGHPAYAAAAYQQQASYGMQHPIGMGRGFPGYGAMGHGAAAAPGYAGAPGPAPGYGYGAAAPGVAAAAYDPNAAAAAAMYGRATAPGYGAPYGAGAGVAGQQPNPASAAAAAAAGAQQPGGYPDYGRLQASQAGQPGAPAGAPHVDGAGAQDFSAYGLGSYQQQDLQYGPTRTSFSSDSSFGTYGTAEPAAYTGGAPGYGAGDSFGRGTTASRGFHPYGR